MSNTIVPLDSLSPAQLAEFRKLTTAPKIAWPTVGMCALLILTYIGSYWLCGTGVLPLWVGTLANSVVGYMSFSVIHDSIHRSISSNVKLNDRIGQIGLDLVLPYVDARMFRWAHVLHHRFTSGEDDPDKAFKGVWWSLPFRWMAIDIVYFFHTLKHGNKVSKPYLYACLRRLAVVVAVIAALTWFGYGLEVFMLWFVPSRLILLALGFSFFWLPHVPHDVTQAENFTRATTVRDGHEWLLGPVLQYQNFHLIHHLYPMTPFYNNERVYRLIQPELKKMDQAIQEGFAIHPTIYLAPRSAA